MTTLRWGVLGAANIARKKVIPAIQASNNGQVIGIASREHARAKELAQAMQIPEVFNDYAALLSSSQIDAVYIPLPNSEHRRWAIAAAEAGKHVLCEKPLALNAQEAEEMAQAAERAGVTLAEAFMYRHHPLTKDVLDLLHGGMIGDLRIVRSTFSFGLVSDANIRLSKELGGGGLMAVVGPSGVDESFIGVMRFPDGVVAEIDVSIKAAGGTHYELIGTNGRILVRQGFRPEADEEGEIQVHQNGEISRIFTDAVDQYQLMVEEFGRAVLDSRPLRFPAQDAVANMRVIDALRDAAV
jgi:predicted dehydrogenase